MALYLAKSFTESSETSEFHDTMIFFTFSGDVRRCLYSCDDRIAQKAEEQVPLITNCFEPPLFSASHKTQKIVDLNDLFMAPTPGCFVLPSTSTGRVTSQTSPCMTCYQESRARSPGGALGWQATVIDKETLQGNSFSGNPATGTEAVVVTPQLSHLKEGCRGGMHK